MLMAYILMVYILLEKKGNEDLFLYYWRVVRAQSLQLCPTLCDPMDYSLSDSSVHGTFQAKILESIAMPSSRGSSRPRDRTQVSYICLLCQAGSLPLVPPGRSFYV